MLLGIANKTAYAQNLLLNSGFESEGASWNIHNSSVSPYFAFDGVPRSGSKALRIFGGSGNGSYISQLVNFQAGQAYEYSFSARYDSLFNSATVISVSSLGSPLGTFQSVFTVPNDGLYYQFSGTLLPSSGADKFAFSFANGADYNTLTIDDVVLSVVVPECSSLVMICFACVFLTIPLSSTFTSKIFWLRKSH